MNLGTGSNERATFLVVLGAVAIVAAGMIWYSSNISDGSDDPFWMIASHPKNSQEMVPPNMMTPPNNATTPVALPMSATPALFPIGSEPIAPIAPIAPIEPEIIE